jgi:hypothetical protein
MLIKKGDIYRNRETNIACFIREVKNDSCQVVWCFKSERGVEHWGRPIQSWEEVVEGPDGYIEYRVMKTHSEMVKEISGPYLNLITYGNEDIFIMNWIPQHTFIAAK